MSSWTPDRVALLKKLVAMGLSASVCAARLGGFENCSDKGRSAVIGKIDRLRKAGLIPPMGADARTRSLKRGGRQGAKRAVQQNSLFLGVAALRTKVFEPDDSPAEDGVIPPGERKTLMQLEDGDCRYPIGHVGEPGFHFCARPKVPGLSYCPDHARRCYQPPQVRRREAEVVPFPVMAARALARKEPADV